MDPAGFRVCFERQIRRDSVSSIGLTWGAGVSSLSAGPSILEGRCRAEQEFQQPFCSVPSFGGSSGEQQYGYRRDDGSEVHQRGGNPDEVVGDRHR